MDSVKTPMIFSVGLFLGFALGQRNFERKYEDEKRVYNMYTCNTLTTGLETQICEADKAEIAEMVGKKVFGVE